MQLDIEQNVPQRILTHCSLRKCCRDECTTFLGMKVPCPKKFEKAGYKKVTQGKSYILF